MKWHLSPRPEFVHGVWGRGIQGWAYSLGDEVDPFFTQRKDCNVVWPLFANDMARSIEGQVANVATQALGVVAWGASRGHFTNATGDASLSERPLARTNFNSTEGGGARIEVRDGKSDTWYMLYTLTSKDRPLKGKIEETYAGRTYRLDYVGNTNAWLARGDANVEYDIMPLIYHSQTGTFDAEFWTDGTNSSTSGYVMGALQILNPRELHIVRELARFDKHSTTARASTMDLVTQAMVDIWRLMGGVAESHTLLLNQYTMSMDKIHLPKRANTQLFAAQFVNPILKKLFGQ